MRALSFPSAAPRRRAGPSPPFPLLLLLTRASPLPPVALAFGRFHPAPPPPPSPPPALERCRRRSAAAGWPRRAAAPAPEAASSGSAAASVGGDFWGTPRAEGEIRDFVAGALSGDDDVVGSDVEVLSAEPPLVLIHGFLPESMCDEVISAAVSTGDLKRSTMGAEQDLSDERTSANCWLSEGRHPGAEVPLRTLADRSGRVAGLPPCHMENLQVVHYTPGQRFDVHADHLDSFNDLECRGRLATVLVYLNSASPSPAEEGGGDDLDGYVLTGGETWFPEFDVRVPPRKGSALFWWNTVERPGSDGYDPEMFLRCDARLRHAGLPVLSGEKWACNRWIHPVPVGAGVRGY